MTRQQKLMQTILVEQAARAAMPTDRIIAKLNQTLASVNAHIDRTGGVGSLNNKRSQELADRYTGLKSALVDTGRWSAWSDFCNTIGATTSHNGHDLFA
jgi:hypothetical protein